MNFRYKLSRYIVPLLLLFILNSCSVWENFTTYFNLYYNTSTLFDGAEAEILAQQRDLFSNDPLIVPGSAKNALVKVVEKCSNLLQFNPNSAYVGEALIMLGKSFYYQNNYQKSKRKFEEFLATKPDDDEKVTETNLWIAKCMFVMKENTSALKLIEEVRTKSVEEGYDQLIRQAYIEEIKYQLREENYTSAITLANQFAEVYDESTTRAEIYYELGGLYQITGDIDNEIASYKKVFDYSPDFDLEIAAQIKYANALRDAERYEEALNEYESMRNQDKFLASFNEIDLEIGKTQIKLGNYQAALDKFRMVDSTYKGTPFAAAANYELGELYRYEFLNYDSAQYYYSKAVSGNPPKEYLDEAKSDNQLFQKYGKLRKTINNYKRQLFYSQNPEIFSTDSAAYLEDSLKILNDFIEKKEMQDIWKNVNNNDPQMLAQKKLETTILKHNAIIADSIKEIDSLVQIGLYSPNDTTGLRDSIRNALVMSFVQDSLSKLDSLVKIGGYNPRDTIGLRIKIRNEYVTRSRTPIVALDPSQEKLAQLLRNPGQARLDTVKFKRNPPLKLKITIDSAKTLIAKNSLELGNLFLAEIDVPDSAYYLYKEVLDNYPVTAYYPSTLYAMGSYYLTIDDKEKADSLFNVIYKNYKDQSIVNAAADKLNLPLIDLNYDPAQDQYASAEQTMLNGNYQQSVNQFFDIYRTYPKSNIAPQALYTSGWILENNLKLYDSAAVVYDTLLTKYPSSSYGKNIAPKLTIYKQEKAKIKKAVQDSLLALEKQKEDTVLTINDSLTVETNKNPEVASVVGEQVIPEQVVNNPANKPDVNGVHQKKLEPLWDPRKHFH